MGLPRNDDDDEKKPWTHSCFELSLGHHLPNYRRGASAYVCVCVYAIITTFSKHLRPPEPVFIAGKGMGQHSLGRLFWKMGEEKKKRRAWGWPEGGVQRDREPAEAHRLARPIATCWARDERKIWLSLGKWPLETEIRTGFPDRISQLWKSEKHWESPVSSDRNGKAGCCGWKSSDRIYHRRFIPIILSLHNGWVSLLLSPLLKMCMCLE